MELNLFAMFATVAVAHFLALLSPGPDFILVVKSAIRNKGSKKVGIAAGIASANAVYIALCLLGVGTLLASSAKLLIALKILGGLFLIYLALQALRARKSAYAELNKAAEAAIVNNTEQREFVTGFLSGILNPKNLLFYLSLFTVVLTPEVSLTFKLLLGLWMTLIVFLWDVAIIYLLSANKVRNKFSKLAFYIDKFTGAILGLIGLTIVRSALTK